MGNSPIKPLVLPGQDSSKYTTADLVQSGFDVRYVDSDFVPDKKVLVAHQLVVPTQDPRFVLETVPDVKPFFVLLYSHGNQEDLRSVEPLIKCLRTQFDVPFAVVAYEYTGYGLMHGYEPTEESVYDDATTAVSWILQTFPSTHLFLYGRSLGSAPSLRAAHALQQKCAGVVLQSPLVSAIATKLPMPMRNLLHGLDMFYTVPFAKGISQVPLLIVHGEQDAVVPATHGIMLHDAHGGEKSYLKIVKNGRHNNLSLCNDIVDVDGPTIAIEIKKFILSNM